MTQYILKRLLLMVPTFLLITLLVFVMINLAPGTAGQAASASGSEQADQSAAAREGYRLFKEQYNLDLPIILNFRFLLDEDNVMRHLEVVARNLSGTIPGEREAFAVGRTAAGVVADIVNEPFHALARELADPDLDPDERAALQRRQQEVGFRTIDPRRPPRPAQGAIFDSEERLEDWGHAIVPELLAISRSYVWIYRDDVDSPWLDGVGILAETLGLDPSTRSGSVEWRGENWRVHTTLTDKVRFLAVQRLSVNARRRVLIRDGERGTEEQRAANRMIVSENNRISQWTWSLGDSPERQQEILAEWEGWWEEASIRYERTGLQTLGSVFLDTRFAAYWANLARLDFGTSIRYRRPVMQVIGEHWMYSVYLSVMSLLLAYFISVPIGILAAVKQNTFADRGVGIALFVLYSLPSFFVATLAQTYLTPASPLDADSFIGKVINFFAVFPVSGFNSVEAIEVTTWELLTNTLWHMVLPVICLTYMSLAVLSRYARTGLLDVIRSDYIRTARAKGLSEWVVIMKHAVRNGMIPILTLLGTTLPVLIGGSIVIEYIFVIEGMGSLMIGSIFFRDYNVIMGILLLSSILTLVGILLSDISYALVDPRISFD
ncbi:MAG: ABC transporter permease subunit [Deltaproteobacteria bacterium]|nr:MAG: ABC transporter permease subunit [Deltaproteobacteria bacterium]